MAGRKYIGTLNIFLGKQPSSPDDEPDGECIADLPLFEENGTLDTLAASIGSEDLERRRVLH